MWASFLLDFFGGLGVFFLGCGLLCSFQCGPRGELLATLKNKLPD
jgi:hypothetical protein